MVAQYEQVSIKALKGASKDSIREPNSNLVPGLFLLLHSSAGSVEEEAVALSPSPDRGRLPAKLESSCRHVTAGIDARREIGAQRGYETNVLA